MKWSDEYKVHYYYTDYNNILKPSYIGRYMQETAWNALKNRGPTPEYLKSNNIAFILSKISFRYYSVIREDDIIKAETWANPPKTVIFPRNYRIYNMNRGGEIAAEAVSAWALLDMKEKNILKPAGFKDVFVAYDDEELTFGVQKRFNMPQNMAKFSEYNVRCSDIDSNMHMNNAAYIDLICDNLYDYNGGEKLTAELNINKRIISLDLNYNTEAVFSEAIEISKGVIISENGMEEHYISGCIKSGGQNCFESKVILSNKLS